MGFKEYQIILDSPVYYAGQYLTGKLIVKLKKPKKFKGIYLKYFGKGNVQWTEGWGNTTVTHSNNEIYLTSCQLIFGNEIDDSELSEGKHVFEFSYQLPNDLPYSFDGFYGGTRYTIKAIIDQPWKNVYVAKQPITIMSILDLRNCQIAGLPVEERSSKTFWGQSKPLTISFYLPFRGFIPGQIIPIKLILNNESDVQVKSIEVSLKQNISFHGLVKSSTIKESILKEETEIQEGIGYNEMNLNIRTPILSPSYLQFCNIIDIRYQMDIKAKVSGCHRSHKISTEIIIGNIPVIGCDIISLSPSPSSSSSSNQMLISNELLNYQNSSMNYDFQPPPYALACPDLTTYENLPPPPYEQMTEIENIQGIINREDELTEFPPLYTVQNICDTKT